MFEDLKNIINNEYDKIETEDDNTSSIVQESINSKIENQNKRIDEETKSSKLLENYLETHNKGSINDLTTEEITELVANIDEEIKNME